MRPVKVVLIAVSFMSAVSAQSAAPVHFVRASGEAVVTAKPDRAEVSIGVMTHSQTAQRASEQNAAETTRVLDSLKKLVAASGDIKTAAYSLTPEYKYEPGKSPELTGFQSSNTVLVTINDLSRLGKLIDTATTGGANNINGIAFTVHDDTELRAQALAEATRRARLNAEAIANALGLSVTRVLQAEPTEMPPIRPLAEFRSAAMTATKNVSTPVEPGNIEFRAAVTVTLEVR
jgi:uncharacterized protein YggE